MKLLRTHRMQALGDRALPDLMAAATAADPANHRDAVADLGLAWGPCAGALELPLNSNVNIWSIGQVM